MYITFQSKLETLKQKSKIRDEITEFCEKYGSLYEENSEPRHLNFDNETKTLFLVSRCMTIIIKNDLSFRVEGGIGNIALDSDKDGCDLRELLKIALTTDERLNETYSKNEMLKCKDDGLYKTRGGKYIRIVYNEGATNYNYWHFGYADAEFSEYDYLGRSRSENRLLDLIEYIDEPKRRNQKLSLSRSELYHIIDRLSGDNVFVKGFSTLIHVNLSKAHEEIDKIFTDAEEVGEFDAIEETGDAK